MLCFSSWETNLEKRANSNTRSHRYQYGFSNVCRAVSVVESLDKPFWGY